MRALLVLLCLLVGLTVVRAEDDWAKDAVWITGDVINQDNVLLYRLDKPVAGNPMGNLVMLGATKNSANTLLPMYMRAAEKKVKLRLYGVLLPVSAKPPGHKGKLPNVQFITWKIHMPDDPDELPPDQKIPINPKATPPGGIKIEKVK